jgi:hypothetical protein
MYQFSNSSKFLFRASHNTLVKAWHHLEELLEDAMFLSLSEETV